MIRIKRDKRDWCGREGRMGYKGVEYNLPLMEPDELRMLDLDIQTDKALLEDIAASEEMEKSIRFEAKIGVAMRKRQQAAIAMDFLRRKKLLRPLDSFAFSAVWELFGPLALQEVKDKARELQDKHRADIKYQPKKKKDFTPYVDWVEEKMCGEKVRHVSESSANEQIENMKSNKRNTTGINVYECPFCGYFHVGHKPKGGVWTK